MSIHCEHCQKEVPPERTGPLLVSANTFISCPHCGRDIYDGQPLEEWKKSPCIEDGGDSETLWLDEIEITQPQASIAAPEFLEAAAGHMRQRAEQRDSPGGERSMAKTVAAFNELYNHHISEEEGWMFMALLKASRASHGIFVKDDYEDGAAYFALAGEAASTHRAMRDE